MNYDSTIRILERTVSNITDDLEELIEDLKQAKEDLYNSKGEESEDVDQSIQDSPYFLDPRQFKSVVMPHIISDIMHFKNMPFDRRCLEDTAVLNGAPEPGEWVSVQPLGGSKSSEVKMPIPTTLLNTETKQAYET